MPEWIEALRTVAPIVATTLGGPLAGTAVTALSTLLFGKPDAEQDAIARMITTATPETLAKLKALDQEFAVHMRRLDIDLEQLATSDRASARQREVAIRDRAPFILACCSYLGFFGMLGALVLYEIPASGQQPLAIMLGALGTIVASISSYYFGSSAGSARKTELLSVQANGHVAGGKP